MPRGTTGTGFGRLGPVRPAGGARYSSAAADRSKLIVPRPFEMGRPSALVRRRASEPVASTP